jgi:hypothetical protein
MPILAWGASCCPRRTLGRHLLPSIVLLIRLPGDLAPVWALQTGINHRRRELDDVGEGNLDDGLNDDFSVDKGSD